MGTDRIIANIDKLNKKKEVLEKKVATATNSAEKIKYLNEIEKIDFAINELCNAEIEDVVLDVMKGKI